MSFLDPKNFHEAQSFAPERWLKPEHALFEERFAADNRAICKPFSHGPRDCLGKNLAYLEMRLIVAKVLFDFDVEAEPGQEDWRERQKSFVIWEKGPLNVRFTPRKSA